MRTLVLDVLFGVLGVAAGAAPMAAQALLPTQSGNAQSGNAKSGDPAAGQRYFVDSIVASVNDSSILQSKLFQAADGEIRGRELEGGRMSLGQIKGLTVAQLRNLVADYQMAQSARSFGNFPPERFDAILNGELDRDQQDRVREVGNAWAFSEELARTGQTWQTHRESMRLEKLTMLAKSFAIHQRFNKQANLYLTPRMLRETYQKERSKFVREAAANVAFIVFTGPDAAKNAADAVEHWRSYNWTAREVAGRYGAGATAGQTLPSRALDSELKAFALAGPRGKVTDPIALTGGRFEVAKIVDHVTASDGHFEDPEVQAVVRQMAREQVLREFGQQAQQRARNRTMVWVYENGQRLALPMR